jgi:hypothetical protein
MDRKTVIERAFDLADEGLSLNDIKHKLRSEGYAAHYVSGRTIAKQLRMRAEAAKENDLPALR